MAGAAELRNYSSAIATGAYDRDMQGLQRKHDNVRRFWEDQINRYVLSDFLADLAGRKESALERVRVLDLGCGAGEGYEILTNVQKPNVSLATKEVDVLPVQMIGYYRGVDLCPEMVQKAREIYAANPKLAFETADLNDGLPVEKGEPPYDIYFSSFGSLSHLEDEALGRLLEGICDQMGESAIIVADMVGRYSYEWPQYWDEDPEARRMRPYSMSYIYPPEARKNGQVEVFPIRYWGGEELEAFVREICSRKGVKIVRRMIHDRSILVGRHMDTAEFNPNAQALREAVCSLHEFNIRTDLSSLLFDYIPRPEHPRLNTFFEQFQMAWNAVVYACMEALENWNNQEKLQEEPSEDCSDAVQRAIATVRAVVRNVRWFRMGDPLANIVEPQLGYVLRNLEIDMQRGMGAAHGVLATFELAKE